MVGNRRTQMLLAVAVLIALIGTVYSACAYSVASHVFNYNGSLYWPTPGYTFLPWPTMPTGPVISIIESLNQADTQYYRYIIQSGVLIVLTVLLWIAVFWRALKLRKTSLHDPSAVVL